MNNTYEVEYTIYTDSSHSMALMTTQKIRVQAMSPSVAQQIVEGMFGPNCRAPFAMLVG